MRVDGGRAGDGTLAVLSERLSTKDASVAVVGLGYVGLPVLVTVARAGFRPIGHDLDPEKIATLEQGRSYISDVADSELAVLEQALLDTDPTVLERADVILICVPTPLTENSPDLSMVSAAAAAVAEHLRPSRLVVLESTTYPGTTDEIVRPVLESSGLQAGVDFALAYSPERISPGHREHTLDAVPKIVAGVTERCRDLAVAFYSQVARAVVTTSSPREAEMAKLVENTFRQVNIALVNELAIMAQDLGVDIWEALEAAGTKPFGYMPFWPGPGVGGHCIAIDPAFLSWRVGKEVGHGMGFIEHANRINNRMPDYVVSRLGDALNERAKPLQGSRILALGAAYKDGVNDVRGSPAIAVMERLIRKGADVSFHDPFVEEIELGGESVKSMALTEELVAEQDCVAILTAHPDVDYPMVLGAAALVFDARGVTAGMAAPSLVRL
jgi:UDP-N-acetyl-D-glucosamine dehydrogenase